MVIVVDCKSMGLSLGGSNPLYLIFFEYSLIGRIAVSKIVDVGSNPITLVFTHSLIGKAFV